MAVELDDFDAAQKRRYVLVGVTIGTVFAISTTGMRTWAKYISTSRIQAEDYFMGAALCLCIALASCLYYSQSIYEPTVSLWNLTQASRLDNRLRTARRHPYQTPDEEFPHRKSARPSKMCESMSFPRETASNILYTRAYGLFNVCNHRVYSASRRP